MGTNRVQSPLEQGANRQPSTEQGHATDTVVRIELLELIFLSTFLVILVLFAQSLLA